MKNLIWCPPKQAGVADSTGTEIGRGEKNKERIVVLVLVLPMWIRHLWGCVLLALLPKVIQLQLLVLI